MGKFIKKLPPYICTVIVTGLILYLTLDPQPLPDGTPLLFPHADKLVHAIMFGSFFCAFAFDHCRRKSLKHMTMKHTAILLMSTIAFGGIIEIAQGAMGLGRGCDPIDFISDVIGSIAALIIYKKVNRLLLGVS